MQNNFSDNMHQLQNFNLEPSTQVWQEIEKKLDEKRKKRIVAWWWILPVLGLVTITMLVINKTHISDTLNTTSSAKNNHIPVQNTPSTVQNSPIYVQNTHNSVQNTPSTVQNSPIYVQNTHNSVQNTPPTAKNSPISVQNTHNSVQNTPSTAMNSPISVKHSSILTDASNPNNNQIVDVNDQSSFSTNNLLHNNNSNNITLKNSEVDLSKKSIVENNLIIAKTDSVNISKTTVKNILPKATKQKLQLSLAFGGGVNYISSNNIFGKNENTNTNISNLTSSPTASTPATNNPTTLPLPKTGVNFSVGVNIDYNLSKKWSLQSGLKYAYIENSTNLKTTSQSGVFNNVQDMLVAGNKISYTNYFHLLEIPINVQYCINSSSKNTVSFVAGFNTSIALAKHHIYANNEQGNYSESNSNINSVFWGLQTGATINFNNKFSLGLFAKKSITPVQKSSSKYYWQQLNFQINIPFKSLKK